jgi:hypothetical protein
MTRGPSWPQAIPELPYVRHTSYQGQDVLLGLTFLDSQANLATPTSLTYRVDSLDSAQNVIPLTVVAVTGTSQTLQLPGAKLVMTRQTYGRENMQVWVSAVVPDATASSGSITVNTVVIIELIAISVPS